MTLHGPRPGVIGCVSQAPVAKAIVLRAQVTRASVEILLWVEHVGDAELRGGLRHELHQAVRTGLRDRVRIEVALRLDYGAQPIFRNAVLRSRALDRWIESVRKRIVSYLFERHLLDHQVKTVALFQVPAAVRSALRIWILCRRLRRFRS